MNINEKIFGYGTSHDSGICVIDAKTGYPLSAISRERYSRIKSDGGDPQCLLNWSWKSLNENIYSSEYFLAGDERIFNIDNGFYAIESSSIARYHWTKKEVKIELNDNFNTITIKLIPKWLCFFDLKAEITINDNFIKCINNNSILWNIKSLNGEPIRKINLICSQILSIPPDTRELGIMIEEISLRNFEKNELISYKECVAEAPAIIQLGRLWRKQFYTLPRFGLRGCAIKNLVKQSNSLLKLIIKGYKTHSETIIKNKFGKIVSRWDHHLCHAASAYWPSGLDKSLVISMDGQGDYYSCRIFKGDGGKLISLDSYFFEQQPTGMNYALVTAMLGFKATRHEGKITGLAAFGHENTSCRLELDKLLDEIWKKNKNHFPYWEDIHPWSNRGIQWAREIRETRFASFSREDIAYAIQKRTEDEVLELIRKYRARFPELTNITLAGGVFANVKLNQRIKEMDFENIFIQPAMSDAGLCLGAALLEVVKHNGGQLTPFCLDNVYLGPEFSTAEIQAELSNWDNLKIRYIENNDDIVNIITEKLISGKVIAHFNGRMEFGPRALGNRSILYTASDPTVNQWLNQRLRRTEFMPFAPVAINEAADEYFENLKGARHTAEFMTITFNCTEKAKKEIPAAIHIDGTARPQLVRDTVNPRLHAILSAYQKFSGIPVLINTSFNMHEEPIVATPRDALRSFTQGQLDYLILNNFIITHT